VSAAEKFDLMSHSATLEWIPISDLYVDPHYQRPLREAKLQRFTTKFDFNAVGALWVSKRSEHTYAIIDGQHRTESIRRVFGDDAEAPCLVFTGLTDEEEAQLFVLAQNRVHLGPGQEFKAELHAKLPEAIAIKELAERYGFSITSTVVDRNADGVIMAIGALRGVYRLSPEVLDRTLMVLSEAWEGERRSLQQDFIRGMGAFLNRYEGEASIDRLITKLRTLSPQNLARRADIFRAETSSSKAPVAFGRAILAVYNSGLREGGRLSEWFSTSPDAIRHRRRRIKMQQIETEKSLAEVEAEMDGPADGELDGDASR
jgi:hypothetical protein